MVKLESVKKSYNMIVTILKALTDPEHNHSSVIVVEKKQKLNLTDHESKIIKEQFAEDGKKVHAPYMFNYNGSNIYLILKDGFKCYTKYWRGTNNENIDYYIEESPFEDVPSNVFICVNTDAFMFELGDIPIDAAKISIIKLYSQILDLVLLEQGSKEASITEIALLVFMVALFFKTMSNMSNEEIGIGLYWAFKPFSKQIKVVTEYVDDLLRHKEMQDTATTGFLVDKPIFVEKVMEFCNSDVILALENNQ